MKTKVLSAALLMAAISLSLTAQDREKRFSVELNGGLSLSLNHSGDPVTNVGAGSEAIIHYRLMNHLGLYGGWGYNAFRNDYEPAGQRCDLEETGYIIGLQYKHKIEFSDISVFVRGAFQYKHIEVEDPAGELIFDTTHGPGWQAGFGIDVPLAAKLSLIPEVKFSALTERKDKAVTNSIPDRNYFSLRLGILKKF